MLLPTCSTTTCKVSSTGTSSSPPSDLTGRTRSLPPKATRSMMRSRGWSWCALADKSSGCSKLEKANTGYVMKIDPIVCLMTWNFCFQFGDSQKLRLVRILRSTVMVRVGGGWVALDEFLVKNDPCRGKCRMKFQSKRQQIISIIIKTATVIDRRLINKTRGRLRNMQQNIYLPNVLRSDNKPHTQNTIHKLLYISWSTTGTVGIWRCPVFWLTNFLEFRFW